METRSGIEAGQHSKGRRCFESYSIFFRTLYTLNCRPVKPIFTNYKKMNVRKSVPLYVAMYFPNTLFKTILIAILTCGFQKKGHSRDNLTICLFVLPWMRPEGPFFLQDSPVLFYLLDDSSVGISERLKIIRNIVLVRRPDSRGCFSLLKI